MPFVSRITHGAEYEVAEDTVHSRTVAQCPLRPRSCRSPYFCGLLLLAIAAGKARMCIRWSNLCSYLLLGPSRDRRPMCRRRGQSLLISAASTAVTSSTAMWVVVMSYQSSNSFCSSLLSLPPRPTQSLNAGKSLPDFPYLPWVV